MQMKIMNHIKLALCLSLVLLVQTSFSQAQNRTVFVTSVSWSPDGSVIAVGYGTPQEEGCTAETALYAIRLVTLSTQTVTKTLTEYCNVTGLAFKQDGTRLVSVIMTGLYTIWNVDTQEDILRIDYNVSSQRVKWQPDGEMFLVVRQPSILVLTLDGEGVQVAGKNIHSDMITDADWSPDGRSIASSSEDRNVRVWNVETEQSISVFQEHSTGVVMN